MKNSWFIVVPFAKGYLGSCKKGQIYGSDRQAVIKDLIALAFQ